VTECATGLPPVVTKAATGPVQLIDMVFPGDTNHHGTLFGGVALAHMDKVAFLAASRHGRAPFVTAASEKTDFAAPARAGDMVEVTDQMIRVGNRSLDVEVESVAEAPVTGERRLCTCERFTLVAQKGPDTRLPLPQIGARVGIDHGLLRLTAWSSPDGPITMERCTVGTRLR
jgi:acyl-CoA hydrolase